MAAGQHGHQAVDDRGDDTARDRVLDRLHRAEPGDDVADMALLEEVGRQAQQVAHEIADDLEGEQVAEHAQRPVAQRLDAGLHQDERAEAERHHEQQVAVGVEDRLVDDELQLERRRKRRDLQRQRQQSTWAKAPLGAGQLRPQHGQLHRDARA